MSGIYVGWLADAARLTGYPVAEVSGWKSRGHGGLTSCEGVVCHHTAGPKTGEYPSLQVVRDGRTGLPGPLANLGLGRSGTVYVIAAGLAYHAGVSSYAGFTDLNYRFLGIEAESTGLGSGDWTPEQRDCYPRLVAALLYYMRRNAARACAHRECAPGRKIDPTGIDMPAFRARVGQLLTDPLRLIPATQTLSEDDMPSAREVADAILDTPITRQGDLLPDSMKGSKTTLRNEISYMTNESYRVAQLAAKVAATSTGQVDPAAVRAGVADALGGGLQITGTAVPTPPKEG